MHMHTATDDPKHTAHTPRHAGGGATAKMRIHRQDQPHAEASQDANQDKERVSPTGYTFSTTQKPTVDRLQGCDVLMLEGV